MGAGMSAGAVTMDAGGARGMLSRAVIDVVDRFAAVVPQAAADLETPAAGDCLLGSSCFHGPVAGLVSIAVPTRLCEAMLAGFGASGPCREELAASVLGELANMIASQVALELEPAEVVMMTPPTVERSSDADWITLNASRDAVRLSVDGWPVLALLSLQAA